MSSHPPTPPNCPHFIQSGTNDSFHFLPTASLGNGSFRLDDDRLTWGVTSKAGWMLDTPPPAPWMRPIAAGVARCAWLDEATLRHGSGVGDYEEARHFARQWADWSIGLPHG